jgi:hypothetical protein
MDDRAVSGKDGLSIPYLLTAEDIEWNLNGGWKKIGGAGILNTTKVASTTPATNNIRNITSFWYNASSSEVHRFVAIVNNEPWYMLTTETAMTKITSNTLTTGGGLIISFAQLDDKLYIADSAGGVFLQWDGTDLLSGDATGTPGATEFGTNVPSASILCVHNNFLFAAGDSSNPSTLYVSPNLGDTVASGRGPAGDWDPVGGDGATYEISPDDGDVITGMASFRNNLFIFKGPHTGSIWRLTGTTFAGGYADASLQEFSIGVGCVAHNSIFRFGNSMGFLWKHGVVYTLNATERFGDMESSTVSFGLNDEFLRKRVNNAQVNKAWASVNEEAGQVLIGLPIDGSTEVNAIIMMDFRFPQLRWAHWKGLSDFTSHTTAFYPAQCAAFVVDSADSDRSVMFIAGSDGYIRKLDRKDREFAITPTTGSAGSGETRAISCRVRTPYLSYGNTRQMKTLMGASIGNRTVQPSMLNFRWTRDENATQSTAISISGGHVLAGPTTDPDEEFILGHAIRGVLGGAAISPTFFDLPTGDEFRQISYEIHNDQLNPDIEVDDFSVLLSFNADSEE